MPERNEEDTMFERTSAVAIPTKKHPQTVSELSIVQQSKYLDFHFSVMFRPDSLVAQGPIH